MALLFFVSSVFLSPGRWVALKLKFTTNDAALLFCDDAALLSFFFLPNAPARDERGETGLEYRRSGAVRPAPLGSL